MASEPRRLPELGFYTLAGAPESPRELIHEVRRGEELGLGSVFISERWNIKEAVTLSGAVGAVSEAAPDRHRRDQPQHAPPARDGVVRDHHAPAHRRTLHPRHRTRHQADVPGVRHPGDHDRADGGLRRAHAAALARRDDLRPRRSRREVSRAAARLALRRGHPARHSSRSRRTRSPLGGRAFDQVILHTFFTDETLQRCVRTVKRRRRKRVATRRPSRCGRASRPSAITSPSRCVSRRPSAGSRRTCRSTATSW